MTENYHTHTTRCRHATGTDEEYVLQAIDGGLQESGFEMETEEDLDSEASAFLDQIMGRSNALNSIPTVQPAAAQPVQQEAAADESSELLSKMLQELKD